MLAKKKRRDLDQLIEDDTLIQSALQEGVRDALRRHKEAGLPVASWQNGKVVWIPAEKIRVDGASSRSRTRKSRRTAKP